MKFNKLVRVRTKQFGLSPQYNVEIGSKEAGWMMIPSGFVHSKAGRRAANDLRKAWIEHLEDMMNEGH